MKSTCLFLSFLFLHCFQSAIAQMTLNPFLPGVSRITGIVNAGDDRLFIVEQPGRILVSDLVGNLQPDTFLNITGRVRSAG